MTSVNTSRMRRYRRRNISQGRRARRRTSPRQMARWHHHLTPEHNDLADSIDAWSAAPPASVTHRFSEQRQKFRPSLRVTGERGPGRPDISATAAPPPRDRRAGGHRARGCLLPLHYHGRAVSLYLTANRNRRHPCVRKAPWPRGAGPRIAPEPLETAARTGFPASTCCTPQNRSVPPAQNP